MENNCGAKRSCGAGVPPVEQTSGHPARIGHTNYMHHSLSMAWHMPIFFGDTSRSAPTRVSSDFVMWYGRNTCTRKNFLFHKETGRMPVPQILIIFERLKKSKVSVANY
jgi:hypothetical protein